MEVSISSLIRIFLFAQGPLTSPQAVNLVQEATAGETERRVDILLYRKNGESNRVVSISPATS